MNRLSHIVHWAKYYPPDIGGIESVTASLSRGTVAAGHSVTVVCFHKGNAPCHASLDGVQVRRAPVLTAKASQPLGLRYFLWCLRESRTADIVHLHSPNMLAALAAVLLNKKQKLIVHWHSDVIGKGWLGRLLAPLEKTLLSRADSIVCTSQAYADASMPLQKFTRKISVVPIGVPDMANATRISEECNIPAALNKKLEGARLLLAIGRLVSYKGFHVLVEAAKSLPSDVVVVIVGAGPLHVELQKKIDAEGLADKVILASCQKGKILDALYRRAALFCLPSVGRSEAFGVVLIEAMSYGLPIVATQIEGSGVPWVNEHGVSGLNVPAGDVAALADACNAILNSSDLRKHFSLGARKRYEQEFTENVSVGRMLKIYKELLE